MNDEEKRRYEQELIEDANRLMEEIDNDPLIRERKAPPEARERIFMAMREQEERAMMEGAKRLMEEVNNDPALKDVKAPADAYDNIIKAIRAKEAEREIEHMSDENRELIRLGKIYKRRRKNRKYLVLAATMILALAFGITSVGGPEKIFETVKRYTLGREQSRVNSNDDVELVGDVDEETVYEKIEEKYGFYPVRLDYLPEGVEFQEVAIGDEIQGINLIYGDKERGKIAYFIRPNYRSGSLGIDVEDKLIDSYSIENENTVIEVKQYYVKETDTLKWKVEFSYQDAQYVIIIYDAGKFEIENILKNLYFV